MPRDAITIRLDGVSRMLDELERIPVRGRNALKRAINRSTLLVERRSKQKTPVDTGNLRASQEAQPAEETKSGVVGRVLVQANYAIYVHELHKTKSKYLERALRESEKDIRDIIAQETRRALGGR